MDPFHARIAGLKAPPIPSGGLHEVLSRWIGRGDLFEGLALPSNDGLSDWSASDIEARAHRVLLEQIKPLVSRLPTRVDKWTDVLPAVRLHEATTTQSPTAGTSWPATRIRYGWPPSEFVGRQAARHPDSLLSTALKWTFERLGTIRDSAIGAYPDADADIRAQLDADRRAIARAPLALATAIRPGRHDLVAIRRAGSPWGTVSDIANRISVLDASPETLASELLIPDENIRWRLFHLAILGELLQAARSLGCQVTSRGPLRPGGGRSSFRLTEGGALAFELWFEAAGIWRHLGIRPPYAEATSGIALKDRSLGADLLLCHPNGRCFLVIECKYSWNPDFVARNGYYQAVAYAAELASRTGGTITAIAVGPEGVVTKSGFTNLSVGRVGVCPPSAIHEELRRFLKGA